MIDLPFFGEAHRRLSERLAGITSGFESIAHRAEGDVDAAAREAIRACAENGLFRLFVPDGGSGRAPDLRSVCLAREAVAAASGFVDAVFAVQGLGSYPIVLSGNTDMAERHLPGVLDGSEIAAFALTEPDAGSDLSALSTRAVRDGNHYVLNGTKVFISNAPVASFFTVFARTSEGPRPLSAFAVDAATPGLTVGPRHAIIAPHPIAQLRFSDCRVPAANLLGGEGDGMRAALGTLDFFRTSVGAAACGMASRGLRESTARAASRRQFGSALAGFQLTQAALADMATELDAARLLVYRSAWTKDTGRERVTRESAMAKLFATEAAQRIIDRAVQIHGGTGVERGTIVERLYREVRALRIYEGTSEIQRLLIAKELLGG